MVDLTTLSRNCLLVLDLPPPPTCLRAVASADAVWHREIFPAKPCPRADS